ncbi:sulfite exporter TauE/SafE family protein [Pusillimonas sp. NJUB218]|uniref:sulfite exporter TauE/SafE family protein n=1 Tax=Pusillimonas sp. NJUB218 TaxID=2023230 RepID=UPI000F4BF281|nr:sulfite exporter TauE/SafE family protein [Pusillimonas sp. NJUB218]ROT44541.1 hypothetical protein CHR62_12580 [Pusillimonas sp. NJUB218]
MWEWSLLFVAAFFAGALNAVAGGGSFLTLPALVLAGIPPVAANATGTAALLPGYIASAWALRHEIKGIQHFSIKLLILTSLVGGVIGACLLLWTPSAVFDVLIPWLLLAATLLFILAPRLVSKRRVGPVGPAITMLTIWVVAIYGGYFNGGLGILLLAVFGVLGVGSLHVANCLKNVVSALLTAIAVVVYIAGGLIYWPQAIWMMAAGTFGGYVGARASRHVPVRYLRWGIVTIGLLMTMFFFMRHAG